MESEGSSAAIQSEIAAKLNFACHQSAFAFLRALRIENTDHGARLNDIRVTLTSNPSFLKPKSWRLDQIAPGGTVSIKDRDVALDGEFLLNLVDSLHGTVTITAENKGRIIAQETKPVELLAYNDALCLGAGAGGAQPRHRPARGARGGRGVVAAR